MLYKSPVDLCKSAMTEAVAQPNVDDDEEAVESETVVGNQCDQDGEMAPEEKSTYAEATYNRNKTLIKQYVNRILDDYPTPSERYYDIRLVSALGRRCWFGQVGDQCIMFHSNRICLITLAPTHPVIADDKTITKIEFSFEADDKIDRLASQPKGKRKRGGQKLRKNAPICALLCSDGTKFIVISCIGSRLLEINKNIAANPDLVKRRPLSEGFIAIVQPNDWKHMELVRESFPKLGGNEIKVCDDAAVD